MYSGASPISLIEYCVTFRHDRRLLSLLGFVHNWPISRWSATKKENRFSFNGNEIMSSFLGRQFHRSALYISREPSFYVLLSRETDKGPATQPDFLRGWLASKTSGWLLSAGCQLLCFDLLTRPKMPFKVMHRKEVIHSNGSHERKSRGRKLADEMGRGKKKSRLYSHRLTHRKRVTSELHDSYFHLMTIKHSISKIEWASNDYIIQLSSTSQSSCQ